MGAFMQVFDAAEFSSESVGISPRAWGGVGKQCFPCCLYFLYFQVGGSQL